MGALAKNQTAVAHVIRHSKGWAVHASEYPWRDSDNSDNFLDLVATNGKFILTVECKKTKEILTFLRPLGGPTTGHVDDFRCLRTTHRPIHNRVDLHYEETWKIWPKSPSCEFCIVRTSPSGRDQRLLEKTSLLIRATDAFAKDSREHSKLGYKTEAPTHRCHHAFYSAHRNECQNHTARYKPPDVSLETGEFIEPPKEVEKAPWVRFSKSFTADPDGTSGTEAFLL